MVPIKEALTFDDVTLAPKYSEILPSEVNTAVQLTKNLKLKIPLLSSAMDTVTESKMAIAIAKSGGIGVIHRNLDIKNQILEIKKVKKQKLLVGAAVGAGPNEFKRAQAIIKEGVDLIVVDTAHGHTKKVGEIIKFIKKFKSKKIALCAGNIATPEAAKFLIKLGVDIIKVGIGPGSICTTRLVAGIGVPQLSAILSVRNGLRNKNVKIISDGGIKYSGDLAKAFAAGADAVMIGSLFAGTDEAPGKLIKNLAASGVAIFPAHKAIFLFLNFFINLIISPTFLVCPWAVSTTIKSTPSLIIASALLNSLGPAPTAAPTNSFCFFTFLISKI